MYPQYPQQPQLTPQQLQQLQYAQQMQQMQMQQQMAQQMGQQMPPQQVPYGYPQPGMNPYMAHQQMLQQMPNPNMAAAMGGNPNMPFMNQQQPQQTGSDRYVGYAKREVPMNQNQHAQIYEQPRQPQQPHTVQQQMPQKSTIQTLGIVPDGKVLDNIFVEAWPDSLITTVKLRASGQKLVTSCFGIAFESYSAAENIQPYVNNLYRVKTLSELTAELTKIESTLANNDATLTEFKRFKGCLDKGLTYELNRFLQLNLAETGITVDSFLSDYKDLIEVYNQPGSMNKLKQMVLRNYLDSIAYSFNLANLLKELNLEQIIELIKDSNEPRFPVLIPKSYNIHVVRVTVEEVGLKSVLHDTDRYGIYEHDLINYVLGEAREGIRENLKLTSPNTVDAREDLLVFSCGTKMRVFEDVTGRKIVEMV